MSLISIDQINEQYLKYGSLRSARKWVASKGIAAIKMGKGYYVAKTDLDKIMNEMLGKTANENLQPKEQKIKTSTKEQSIGRQLLHKITTPEL